MTHSCNNYIIKNEKFLRDFEQMYQDIEDPWKQKEKGQCINFKITLLLLKKCFLGFGLGVGSIKILDIGCANGYQSRELIKIGNHTECVGIDISNTVIDKAKHDNKGQERLSFVADDIRIRNTRFEDKFDIIFCSKTIYYVAPEIDDVIKNISAYLAPNGIFAWIYNQSQNAFSKKWLDYQLLNSKLLTAGYENLELCINQYSKSEEICIGIYRYKSLS
jgi:SAM-dependent methyltransferase